MKLINCFHCGGKMISVLQEEDGIKFIMHHCMECMHLEFEKVTEIPSVINDKEKVSFT